MLCPQWGDGHGWSTLPSTAATHLWHSHSQGDGFGMWNVLNPLITASWKPGTSSGSPFIWDYQLKSLKSILECSSAMATLWLWLGLCSTFRGDLLFWLNLQFRWSGTWAEGRCLPRNIVPGVSKGAFKDIWNKTPGCFHSLGKQCTINILSVSQQLFLTVTANYCGMYRLLVGHYLRMPVFYRMSLLCTIQAKERGGETNLGRRRHSLQCGVWKKIIFTKKSSLSIFYLIIITSIITINT